MVDAARRAHTKWPLDRGRADDVVPV